ncbi:MAG: helix-turn-helix domain-containing protein [Limisphaerales bacterium]
MQYFRPGLDTFYQPHTHSEYNVVVCLSGAVMVKQMGETHVIGPGGVTMGNFGVEHSSAYLTCGHLCEAVCLTVTSKTLAEFLADFRLPDAQGAVHPVFLGRMESKTLLDCALTMKRELQNQERGYKIMIQGLTSRMLVEALRAWPASQIAKCEVDMTPRLPRREFVRAYEFMRWCRKDVFCLQRVSSFIGSSEERFARLFQATTQATPAAFYNRLLLERGRDLLLETRQSVKEVGFQLGFKTPSHFVAAFRLQFGSSPQDFRSRCQGPPQLGGTARLRQSSKTVMANARKTESGHSISLRPLQVLPTLNRCVTGSPTI